MKRLALVALLVLAACGDTSKKSGPDDDADAGPTGDAGVVQRDDQFIRDEAGRALVLRGLNVSHTAKRAKDGLPWVDRDAVLRLRKEFGLNVMRLTMFWRFVEPTQGKYDDAYLGKIADILDWAHEADIFVLLDMHQDLFGFEATDANEGDGPPAWARNPACPAFENQSPWFGNYFTEALNCQFGSFYEDERGVQTAFAAMWKHVAGKLAAHPAVVGVDLFNEPWISNDAKPDDLLGPFYAKLIPAVRSVAPEVRVFYEPGTLSGSITDQSIEKPDFERLVYAPHYYPSGVVYSTEYDAKSQKGELATLYQRHVKTATTAKVPLWIGELGTSATLKNGEQFYRDMFALLEPDFVGFARWAYDSTRDYDLSILDDAGKPVANFASTIEPYAERIPGTPKTTKTDATKRTLVLELDTSAAGELVVSCPKTRCSKKHDVTVKQGGKAVTVTSSYDAELGQLRVMLPRGAGLAVSLSYAG